MNSFWTALDQPEYVHVAVNHFPLIGLLVAVLFLAGAVALNSRPALFLGLALVSLMALTAWPVSIFGEHAYDRVLSMSDDPGGAWLKHHAHLAHHWIFVYYLTTAAGVAAMLAGWKRPALFRLASVAVVVLALGALAAGAVIAESGGKIRHREFRNGPPPVENSSVNNGSRGQTALGGQTVLLACAVPFFMGGIGHCW